MRLSSLSAVLAAAFAWTAAAQEDFRSITLKTHTLEQPYLDSDMQSRWFDFGGDTIIRTDSYIRLTSDRPSQNGWLFSRVPLTATNWEVEVEFKVHGKNSLYGDGFAMWITKQRGQLGPVFGHADKFEGLGIFVDTYKNNRPGVVFPYVMAMFGDGQTSLKLELQYKTVGDWLVCFEVQNPPAIPNIAYLGFSAETGELSDNHDIISVVSKNLYTSPVASGPGKGGSKNQYKAKSAGAASGGSWTWFLFKIVLFILVAGGAYVGFTVYRAKSKSHRF
ncbi:concanavalin A-like lectin/glucanase [Trichoderma longibrachiatum ATCC 18648]|uniref:Concanavalin A-like lectin/glucanase n=1 Tax=Trichoderma longibrachiatum ATCC 18648 TaxID=983965 RepID=A0A2T4CHX0_TRILO|nr:concanavalin A-like lectin/glucanase [Trichoderma longibrachiatum ATCC 18648]